MRFFFRMTLPLLLSKCALASTVYGIEHINQHTLKPPIYVQMGSFSSLSGATRYQHQLHLNHGQIQIKQTAGHYQVRVGPFYDAQSLKQWANQINHAKPIVPHVRLKKPIQTNVTTPRSQISTQHYSQIEQPHNLINNNHHSNAANWYLKGQLGGHQLSAPSATTHVDNGSDFPPPYNMDTYTANRANMSPLAGVEFGRRYELSRQWVDALSLGLQYQYMFNPRIHGDVIQFTLPEFNNYTYSWQAKSTLLLANAKFNLRRYQRFSPYLNLGLGAALNSGTYKENAKPNVTPRISPNYASAPTQFAYTLGAGLDYQVNHAFIVSAGYQYYHLGTLQSGYGESSWSNEKLSLGQYHSNAFLVALTYLFDEHTK